MDHVWGKGNSYRTAVQKSEVNRPLGTPSRGCEIVIILHRIQHRM